MSRFPGHIIKLPANTPSQSSAPGVWTLKDQLVAQRNNQWPFQRDPDFRYTTLLLQGNVPNTTGPQAMNLPLAYNSDASSNNFLITPNGDVSPRPFSPYGGGNYSAYFNGASKLVFGSSSAWTFGTGDFTVEYWLMLPTLPSSPITFIDMRQGGASTNHVTFQLTSSAGVAVYIGSTPEVLVVINNILKVGEWAHIANVRESGVLKVYCNGVLVGKTACTTNVPAATPSVGGEYLGANYLTGYISNLRVSKSARYTSNFTPSTEPLTDSGASVLALQSNRFVDVTGNTTLSVNTGSPGITDNSPFVSADFTTGSGYFNGASGTYLSVPRNSSLLPVANQDFTFEAWVYLTATPGAESALVMGFGEYGLDSDWNFFINSSLQIGMWFGSVTSAYINTTQALTLNTWCHVAVSRSGTAANNLKVFVNGIGQSFSQNATTVSTGNRNLSIGADQDGTESRLTGYIADTRIINGQALYTGNFTPPTSLLSATSVGTSGANVASSITGTVALLTLQTRAPSQNHGFIDSSPNEFIVTRNGNVSQGTFSPFSPTGWGNYLNSTSGNYLSVPASNAFDVGTNNFTAELWFYINPGATSYNGWGRAHILGGAEATSSSRIAIVVNGNSLGSSGLTWSVGSTSGSYATAIAQGVWHHVALVRSGTAITLYLNGTAVSTGNSSASIANNIQHIGAFRATDDQFSDYFYGYVSNVRFIKNQALFSGSTVGTTYFTPSTAPLTTTSVGSTGAGAASSITGTVSLLTCQSNRFLDQTGKTLTVVGSPSVQPFSPFAPANSVSPLVTGGSGYFDGNADYLTAPSGPSFNFGTGDFTIECWVYQLSRTAAEYDVVWTLNGPGVTGTVPFRSGMYLSLGAAGGGLLVANSSENGWSVNISVTLPTLFTWEHYAVTRSGNTWTVYKNGQSVGSANSSAGVINSRAPFTIGTQGTEGNNYFDGYISGFRVVNGTALYTSNFAVPTAPPTAIPGTSLLLNFTGGGIVDATGKNVIETVGNAHVTAAQAKWDFQRGGAAPQFDGGTDCLFEASSPNYGFGTGDFTIEFWLRLNNTGTQTLVSNLTTASSVAPHLYYQLNSNIRYFTNGADRITGSALNANQWYHIAVCRSNGNTRLFVDGSQVGATYPDTNNYGTSNPLGVGDYGVPLNGASTLNGYISNLRVTKSARYTVNFNTNLPNGPFPIG